MGIHPAPPSPLFDPTPFLLDEAGFLYRPEEPNEARRRRLQAPELVAGKRWAAALRRAEGQAGGGGLGSGIPARRVLGRAPPPPGSRPRSPPPGPPRRGRARRAGARARRGLACPRRGGKLSWEKLGAAGGAPRGGPGGSRRERARAPEPAGRETPRPLERQVQRKRPQGPSRAPLPKSCPEPQPLPPNLGLGRRSQEWGWRVSSGQGVRPEREQPGGDGKDEPGRPPPLPLYCWLGLSSLFFYLPTLISAAVSPELSLLPPPPSQSQAPRPLGAREDPVQAGDTPAPRDFCRASGPCPPLDWFGVGELCDVGVPPLAWDLSHLVIGALPQVMPPPCLPESRSYSEKG
ncbi:translation initiation factor IF-2-like [Moschus berezovskii]|uniref:translation initiation factor IF-2-like n=1 Tax=Moschus berezovskii TaxID=68408 RepID=UPI002443F6DC|nr:translation initiation factor IF-2-like [Moschus berezovskii]